MNAKKKSTLDIDDFVDVALAAAENEFGTERCYVAADHEARQIVLPIKPLSIQWLIESNGWPLGRVTQSGGKYGTMKSSFIFQLIAWYLEAGGFAALIDTEHKTSFSLMRSIIPAEYFDLENPKHKRLLIMNATTINEWQRQLSEQYEKLTALAEKVGRKPSFPIFWAVDSMLGSGSEEGLDYIRAEGQGQGRTFSDAPIIINQYMKSFPNTLLGWPITLHMSHHEKKGITHQGMTRQGGAAPDFYATLDIQFKQGGTTAFGKSMEYNRETLQAKNLTLDIRKSSMGSDVDKKLPISFCWMFDDQNMQKSWWDWDSASAMLLAKYATRLKTAGVMDVEHVAKRIVGEVFWSDALGIKKDNALSAAEFGRLIDDHELRPQIAKVLHIQNHPVFDGSMDL